MFLTSACCYLWTSHYQRNLQGIDIIANIILPGTMKPVWRMKVDVESILANYVAIKLKQFCDLNEIKVKRQQFQKEFPRKRVTNSIWTHEEPPAKRLCKK